jgi:hypothetical protein
MYIFLDPFAAVRGYEVLFNQILTEKFAHSSSVRKFNVQIIRRQN